METTVRKIILHGNSLAVTLPRNHGLQRGDYVSIEVLADGVVKIQKVHI